MRQRRGPLRTRRVDAKRVKTTTIEANDNLVVDGERTSFAAWHDCQVLDQYTVIRRFTAQSLREGHRRCADRV
jgi:predicted transcriptional regulator